MVCVLPQYTIDTELWLTSRYQSVACSLQLLQMCASAAGEFAEAVCSQFMEERMDYFRAVETAIYEESGFQVTQQRCLLDSCLSFVVQSS